MHRDQRFTTTMAQDAFEEGKHPREHGKFTGSGSSAGVSGGTHSEHSTLSEAKATAEKHRATGGTAKIYKTESWIPGSGKNPGRNSVTFSVYRDGHKPE